MNHSVHIVMSKHSDKEGSGVLASAVRRETDTHGDFASKRSTDTLRRRAERHLAKSRGEPTTDAQREMHELQVHQIELELQNDELDMARMEAETTRARYVELYDFSPSAQYTLERDSTICRANVAGNRILGLDAWGSAEPRFSAFVSAGSLGIFKAFLNNVFEKHVKTSCVLTLSTPGDVERMVLVEAACSKHGNQIHMVVMDAGLFQLKGADAD